MSNVKYTISVKTLFYSFPRNDYTIKCRHCINEKTTLKLKFESNLKENIIKIVETP